MIKILIFSDSFKHFEQAIKEYDKRLSKDIEIIKLKPYKSTNIQDIIQKETFILKEKLSNMKWYKILLYIWWNNYNSVDFAKFIFDKIDKYSNVIFIVWWAYWVNFEAIKDNIDIKLSLSDMTFPHSLAFMILLEQIYRIHMIKKWSEYHH